MKKKHILFIFLSLIFLNCNKTKELRGLKLDFETLSNAEQIIILDSTIILKYEMIGGRDSYNYFLLFFDDTHKLLGVFDYPIYHIDSVRKLNIYARCDTSEVKRYSWRSLPNGYKFAFYPHASYRTSQYYNKVIDSIGLNGSIVTLFIREDKEDLCHNCKKGKISDSALYAGYKTKDTLSFNVEELHINYTCQEISHRKMRKGYYVIDFMLVPDTTIFVDFYNKIMEMW